jgi:outer membrane receptor protein involved in Fe transport
VWTYELGTKASLLGGSLRADADVFYSDYTNFQIVGIPPPPAEPANVTSNGGNAWIKGIEWNLTYRANDRWELGVNGDMLTSRFYQIRVLDSPYDVGDNLDFIPKYTITGFVERGFFWGGKPGFMRIDYSHVGPETYRNRNLAGPTPWWFSQSDVIRMLNFNWNLQWNRNLSVGLFAQNLTNNRGFEDPISIQTRSARPRPRTYGLQFSVKFD